MTSIAPDSRAARKCGSSGIESSDTKPNTTLRTLPAAHSKPTSGPPYETIVRSLSDDRQIARTSDIGFRRDPHPPIPIVMPSRSSATTSSSVMRLSGMAREARSLLEGRVALLDERLPGLVGDAGQVQLEREPLLETVGPLHVDRVDPVQRFLRAADDRRRLRRDRRRDLARSLDELVALDHAIHRSVRAQLLRRRGLARVHHRPHPML